MSNLSEEEKIAIEFLQFCAEGFGNDEKIEDTDNPFLFVKAIIEKQQKEIKKLNKVIDDMANVIGGIDHSADDIKRSFMKGGK